MDHFNNHNLISYQNAIFVRYSAFGGLFSSIGSMFGKLSNSFEGYGLLTIITIIMMLGFNTMGMLFFAKGLQASPSTIHATLVSSASNYVSTAIIGSVFYGEETPFLWWFGTLFIILGIVIVSYTQDSSPSRN